MLRVVGVFLASAVTVTASVEDFLGDWTIRTDAKSELTEIKYPVQMTIVREGDHLTGHYADQFGGTGDFSLIATINKDRDLIFVVAGSTKEDNYSPIHHAKIVAGKLRGVCLTTDKMFQWIGTRKKH